MASSHGSAAASAPKILRDGISPPGIEARLLGGFEVLRDGRPVHGFESQKVRVLLAYLLMSRRAPQGRERLAALFWPDQSPARARSCLRQALYNLRSTLAPGLVDPAAPFFVANHQEVGISPEVEARLDVAVFEEALRSGFGQRADHRALMEAAKLYQGDFLSGCSFRDSAELESWVTEQRERLREGVIQALGSLIASCRERGDHPLAIQYAQRLVALDPWCENAHRQLMGLYNLSGRRGRALSHYEDLRGVLDRDLGVEPEGETHALYRSILTEEQQAGERGEGTELVGPIIPLVGRERELAALRRIWSGVQRGRGAFTLIEGEPGVGKSRLAKTFLSEAEASAAAVLMARCHGFEAEVPYRPLLDALRRAVGDENGGGPERSGASPELAAAARLLPDLGSGDSAAEENPAARDRLAAAIWQVLLGLAGKDGGRPLRPVLLLLDDLHLADRMSLGILERLLPSLSSAPIWILATAATGWRAEAVDPLARLRPEAQHGRDEVSQVVLDRLEEPALRYIARCLLAEPGAAELSNLYLRCTGGLPLAVVELTNLLADEGFLARSASGGWMAAPSLATAGPPEPASLQEVILRRFHHLPTSTRRLLTAAAVLGHTFDAVLLREVESEHMAVVECGLEVLLDRWLVRHVPSQWYASRRERDIVLWAHGVRRGSFEFSHEIVRRTIYDALDRTRRHILHRRVAETLEQQSAGDPAARRELLAYHYARAGAWNRTVSYLKQAPSRPPRLIS